MKWICDNNVITDEMVKDIEKKLKIKFPEDFVKYIKKYDGGYPMPNKIMVDGQEEILNNLVSFTQDDISFILDIIEDTEKFSTAELVPIAEDPFGNLFCYSFRESIPKIVFWNHENTNLQKYVCSSFSELITMLHD